MMINQVPTELVEGKTENEILSAENSYWVDKYEALERLMRNDDFRSVISEGYFKDKAIAHVSLLATDHVRKTGTRGELMEALIAISHLEDYFITIRGMGSMPDEADEE